MGIFELKIETMGYSSLSLLNMTKIPKAKIYLITPLRYSPDRSISIPVTEIEIPHSVKNTCFLFILIENLLLLKYNHAHNAEQRENRQFLIAADKKFRKVPIIPQFLLSFEGLVIKEN